MENSKSISHKQFLDILKSFEIRAQNRSQILDQNKPKSTIKPSPVFL